MAALRWPSFRWLLVSTLVAYIGIGMQLTAIAWLALVAYGGSPFLVGLVLAARMLPNLLFGLASGTLADHAERRKLLVIVRLLAIVPALGLALVASLSTNAIWPLLTLSFATGCATVFDTPTRQALVMDTTPRELAPNAMALNATISRLFTAVGALVAGSVIPTLGLPACFLGCAVIFAVATVVGLFIAPAVARRPTEPSTPRPGFRVALAQAALLVVSAREVRALLLAAVACEIFGFSYQTAVPVFAQDVLGAGAEGLGTLNAAASIGGAIAVVALSLVPGRLPRKPLLRLVFVMFGVGLLLLAPSTTLGLASAALVVVGACAAAFDVLQQTLMQLAVPEDQRGRAMGLWVLGIGSAPLGNLEMGALVALLGSQVALAINGGLVLTTATLVILSAPAARMAVRAGQGPVK